MLKIFLQYDFNFWLYLNLGNSCLWSSIVSVCLNSPRIRLVPANRTTSRMHQCELLMTIISLTLLSKSQIPEQHSECILHILQTDLHLRTRGSTAPSCLPSPLSSWGNNTQHSGWCTASCVPSLLGKKHNTMGNVQQVVYLHCCPPKGKLHTLQWVM